MSKLNDIGQPLNSEERMMYGINMRLEVLIEMFSSFLDAYAEEMEIATTANLVSEEMEDVEVKEIDYNELTKAELSDMLEEKQVEHNMRMTKDELIKLIG